MFNNLVHPFDDIINIALSAALLLLGISYAWAQWRKGKSDSDAQTIAGYEAEMRLVKDKVERLEKDNKEYTCQINQLIGENKILKNLLTYQDPEFKKKVDVLITDVRSIKEDIDRRRKENDKRFKKIEKNRNY